MNFIVTKDARKRSIVWCSNIWDEICAKQRILNNKKKLKKFFRLFNPAVSHKCLLPLSLPLFLLILEGIFVDKNILLRLATSTSIAASLNVVCKLCSFFLLLTLFFTLNRPPYNLKNEIFWVLDDSPFFLKEFIGF